MHAHVGDLLQLAVSRSNLPSKPLAWISAASGIALISAIVVGIGFQVPVAFVLLVLGPLLSYVVVVASSLKLLRMSGTAGVDAGHTSNAAHSPAQAAPSV